MKILELLDDADQFELMTKLLKKLPGIRIGSTFMRGEEALQVLLPKEFGMKSGRVILKDGGWRFDIIGGQGHVLSKGKGDEQACIDFFKNYLGLIKEELLSKRERIALMAKLLSKTGFYAKDNDFGWVNVYHLGQFSAMVTPYGQAWEVEAAIPGIETSVRKKRCKDEAAVMAFLNKLKTLEKQETLDEAQDDDVPLVWKLAAQQKAKRKRVSMAAEIEHKGLNFITGEIMNVDIPGAKVEVYAYSRSWYLPMRSEDDSRYTLVKDKLSDFYWVKDIDHDEDL